VAAFEEGSDNSKKNENKRAQRFVFVMLSTIEKEVTVGIGRGTVCWCSFYVPVILVLRALSTAGS
jgi:hypothetical protein